MPVDYVKRIRRSRLTIYDTLGVRTDLYIEHEVLQKILHRGLVGLKLDYPLRTRSKVLKSKVCEVLGYPVPKSFRRTQPRFLGQNFDTYVQKSNNLQIWNEDVSASRRYALIRVDEKNVVTKVRVVTGDMLRTLDKTGTLTHKYQAKARSPVTRSCLVSELDTRSVMTQLVRSRKPIWPSFLPIKSLFGRLRRLLGKMIRSPGLDQERNRGGALHDAVCGELGMSAWTDDGQFPDVTEQLLEIKLQTAPTIDLGLVSPDGTEIIADFPEFHHCDVRYAVFYGHCIGSEVQLDHLVLTTGQDFFSFFKRFGGKIRNAKLQIPLPADFFR